MEFYFSRLTNATRFYLCFVSNQRLIKPRTRYEYASPIICLQFYSPYLSNVIYTWDGQTRNENQQGKNNHAFSAFTLHGRVYSAQLLFRPSLQSRKQLLDGTLQEPES